MSKNKGLRIGNYRITPLGLGTMGGILLLVIAVVVLIVAKPFGSANPDGSIVTVNQPSVEPSAVADQQTPQPTEVPVATPTPAPTPRSATIRSLGEIAIQTNLLNAAKTEDGSYDFTDMFSKISDVIGNADYTVADVEGSLGGTLQASGSGQMITPPSLIDALKNAGVDMFNIANDHALDGLFDDLMASLKNIQSAGLEYIGAAQSAEEKSTPKIVEINGINVGFVSYTETLNGMESKSNKDAISYGVNLISKSDAGADVTALRQAGADVVIAYVSWGEMLNRKPTGNQAKIAKALVTAGVDVIIGCNPHVIQPAAWLEVPNAAGGTNRTLCLCATGNFLSDAHAQYSDSGIIFQFTIQEKADFSGFEITNPTYIPTYVWRVENEDKSIDYQTLAVGQWRETEPEGMSYTAYTRLKEVWAEAQSIMGSTVATVSAD